MRAVALRGFGAAEVLHLTTGVPIPTIGAQDVLIRVKATAVNRADIMQRKGQYPPPPGASDILGLEAAGLVAAIGDSVRNCAVGDRVMALLAGGGYAEYCAVHNGSVMKIPDNLSFCEAAAIPEVFLTAWQCLKFNANVGAGDHVLIHAGASGVGTAASQLVRKALQGVAITTSSAEKVAACQKYADHAVSRTKDEDGKTFANKIVHLVGKDKINAIIDPVFGGGYLEENVEVAAPDATIVVLAFMGGNTIPQFNATPFFRKRCAIRFSTLRSRDAAYKASLVASFAQHALPLFANGTLVPVVDKVWPIDDVSSAHEAVEKNETIGKVILKLED